jgi:cardiolipin synthase
VAVTIPNILTSLRIVAAPMAGVAILRGHLGVALALFVAASVTDGLDGLLARVLHQQSRLGAFLDPLADKSLLLSCYVALAYVGKAPAWLIATIVVRDVLIVSAVYLIYLRIGRFTMAPSLPGKLTTFLQMATAAALLVEGWRAPAIPLPLGPLYIATALATVVSGVHYITVGMRLTEDGGE